MNKEEKEFLANIYKRRTFSYKDVLFVMKSFDDRKAKPIPKWWLKVLSWWNGVKVHTIRKLMHRFDTKKIGFDRIVIKVEPTRLGRIFRYKPYSIGYLREANSRWREMGTKHRFVPTSFANYLESIIRNRDVDFLLERLRAGRL